ncbi:MAG: protein kinase [Acidobacteriota bacterium]
MPLAPGTRLSHYEIVAAIGKGGMGEVYKATDTRLHRDVAIKVSMARFTERFEREARAIASLNHPNICTLHDIGSSPEAPGFLVMEYIEGESPKGPLPLETALAYCRQIGSALEAAHARGIVHRDLKPGNIKIKPDGTVKVLDFGLAKVGHPDTPDTELSPTLTIGMTEAGMILGTAGYMPPEQARGKTVDKRADIWSFGVVLHEMLTGSRLFKGETVTDTLAAVIEREPDLKKVPGQVRPLLRACLQKDPNKRLHDIADAWLLLGTDLPKQAESTSTSLLWPALAGVALLAATGLAFLHFRETPPVAELTRFQMTLPAQSAATATYLALSPDGRNLVFNSNEPDGTQRLWIRSMDTLQARQIAGTEGALSPYWAPDSRWIGFALGGKVKKVEVASGAPPVTLAEVPGNAGIGTWNKDGVIVFGNRASNGGISRVAATGGAVTKLTALDPKRKEDFHSYPVFLPDGNHFLYLRSSTDGNLDGIFLGSLEMKPEDPPSEMLLASNLGVPYVPSSTAEGGGRLLFLRGNTLMAQPFDASAIKLLSEPVPIAENVGAAGSGGFYSASSTGTLVYRTGGGGSRQLSWYDSKGGVLGKGTDPAAYEELAFSPDGLRVAAMRAEEQNDLWLLDLSRNSSTRFTFDPAFDADPVWSPEGSQIAYCSGSNCQNLLRKASNNAGEPEILLQDPTSPLIPLDWSRDGKYLLFRKTVGGSFDLYLLPLPGSPGEQRKPIPLLATPFGETQAKFSPDGRWFAYRSNESGRSEIYVRPFQSNAEASTAAAGGKWMVSTAGGHQPRWSRDGKRLLYVSDAGSLMQVDVQQGSVTSFQYGAPKKLFDAPFYPAAAGNAAPTWDMTPDGQKFLITTLVGTNSSPPTTVVLNWEAALKK